MTDGDPFISLESQTHRADVVASQKTAAPSRLYMNPVRNMRHCWISFCRNSILCARIRAPDTEDNLRVTHHDCDSGALILQELYYITVIITLH
ncbi:Hypothetical predicted protein [Scomber scombrus]|uniref:Uncharacterized protein n=1 Tax=Scomber scombrus TaxID=13677 RepID=A0AAV1PJE8_SCOSC